MVDGDEVGVYDGFQHSFGSKEIVLDHNEGDLPPFKIKTDECLEYLTEGVDPFELLQIPLIRDITKIYCGRWHCKRVTQQWISLTQRHGVKGVISNQC